MNLDDLSKQLNDWHTYRYGERPRNGPRTLEKFFEEVGELMSAHAALQIENAAVFEGIRSTVNPVARDHFAEEAADVLFLLIHMVDGEGASLDDAVESKLTTIWDRAKTAKATENMR